MNAEYLGWASNALFLFGTLLIAYKDKRGFLMCMVGNILYFLMGLTTELISVMMLNIGMFSLNVFSYYKWRTE